MAARRLAAAGLAPAALVAVMAVWIAGPGSAYLDSLFPEQLPELYIEKIEFVDSEIRVLVRNSGPVAADIAMADVNDRIQPAAVEPDASLGRLEAAIVRIPFDWNPSEPYTVGITAHDGTRFEKTAEAAWPAPAPDASTAGFLAAVGAYVGILPVLAGLAWAPFMRRAGAAWYAFFLSLTAGLLLFLGIDSLEEAAEIASSSLPDRYNGMLLVATAAVAAFLLLHYMGSRIARRHAAAAGPAAAGIVLAVGIGLHNFGEGLAVGAAIGLGEAALGASLIAGFALHNATEGAAIAASQARSRAGAWRLIGLAMIAGVPAVLGTWTGGFSYSPAAAAVFFAIAAGAIFQVLAVIFLMIRQESGPGWLTGAPLPAGIAAGMIIMYATSLLAG